MLETIKYLGKLIPDILTKTSQTQKLFGLAEKSAQIVKHLLNKAKNDGTDPYLGLLEYRNTPIDNICSPVQLSTMSHQLISVMPTMSHLNSTVVEAKCCDGVTQAKIKH